MLVMGMLGVGVLGVRVLGVGAWVRGYQCTRRVLYLYTICFLLCEYPLPSTRPAQQPLCVPEKTPVRDRTLSRLSQRPTSVDGAGQGPKAGRRDRWTPSEPFPEEEGLLPRARGVVPVTMPCAAGRPCYCSCCQRSDC